MRAHANRNAHVDHTLKPFCITRGPNKDDFLPPSHLHLGGVSVWRLCISQNKRNKRISSLDKKNNNNNNNNYNKLKIRAILFPVCAGCLEILKISRRLWLLYFGNKILGLFNVVCKICEQLRHTGIQVYSYRSNGFYLVILKKLSEFDLSRPLVNSKTNKWKFSCLDLQKPLTEYNWISHIQYKT